MFDFSVISISDVPILPYRLLGTRGIGSFLVSVTRYRICKIYAEYLRLLPEYLHIGPSIGRKFWYYNYFGRILKDIF